jgi:hypothetical protein
MKNLNFFYQKDLNFKEIRENSYFIFINFQINYYLLQKKIKVLHQLFNVGKG